MNVDIISPWQLHWGDRYSESLKISIALSGYLAELIDSGRLGQVVVDVGSGKSCPITDVISDTGAQIISVDIAAHENASTPNKLFLRLDAEKIINTECQDVKRAIEKVTQFLALDCSQTEAQAPVNSFIFSEIINYIDYQSVIKSSLKWLKPGGRIVIINEPERGLDAAFSDKRPSNNDEIINFLESLDLEIESTDFSHQTYQTRIPEALSMMVLVARKK